MRFEFIAKHRGAWRTRDLCEALGVSRGGFYDWLGRPPSRRSRENLQLLAQVRTSFEQSDRTYGSPRVWRDLRAWGHRCGRHRVARLMRSEGLQARRRRRRLPFDIGERAASAIAPNLLERQFAAAAPNQRWVADFTYIWTHEGWLYFAVVLDLFSRLVVGWSMSSRMTAQLVIDALIMAIWRRGPANELLHRVYRLSQGYLFAKARGAMPVPYRCFTDAERANLEVVLTSVGHGGHECRPNPSVNVTRSATPLCARYLERYAPLSGLD